MKFHTIPFVSNSKDTFMSFPIRFSFAAQGTRLAKGFPVFSLVDHFSITEPFLNFVLVFGISTGRSHFQ